MSELPYFDFRLRLRASINNKRVALDTPRAKVYLWISMGRHEKKNYAMSWFPDDDIYRWSSFAHAGGFKPNVDPPYFISDKIVYLDRLDVRKYLLSYRLQSTSNVAISVKVEDDHLVVTNKYLMREFL